MYKLLIKQKFRCTRQVSAAQLLSETIVTPIDKSDSSLDIKADIIFAGNQGTKVNKLVYNVEDVLADRNLGFVTSHVPTCRQKITD